MNRRAVEMEIVDWGRVGYEQALTRQRELHQAVLEGRSRPTVVFVEHPPVITISGRAEAQRHLLVAPAVLAERGIGLCRTDRGGDITYHGPGQIVAYPIVRLNDLKMNVRQYVRCLEQAIIDTLADFDISGRRDPQAPGVWVSQAGRAGGEGGDRLAKIAAIGVRVRRWVTMHGLALNVEPDLGHFGMIVPCGLVGRPVTSMAEVLGRDCPSMAEVRRRLADGLQEHLCCR